MHSGSLGYPYCPVVVLLMTRLLASHASCPRLRSPNEWESMLHWQDVLVWRNQIYNIVINAFRNMIEVSPLLHQLGYRDKAWSVNKLGSVATQHGCPETCLSILQNMYGYNAMEVQEAFVKIREQAKAYLDSRHSSELMAGLNLLNTTNLDYFQVQKEGTRGGCRRRKTVQVRGRGLGREY